MNEPRTTAEQFEWLARAACRTYGIAPMFPDPSDEAGIRLAKGICQRCPVLNQCLARALETGERHGVWGGLTYDERRAVKRREARARTRAAGRIAVTIVPRGDLL